MSLALLIHFHWGNIGKAVLIHFNTFTLKVVTCKLVFFFFFKLGNMKWGLGLCSGLEPERLIVDGCYGAVVLISTLTHPCSNPSAGFVTDSLDRGLFCVVFCVVEQGKSLSSNSPPSRGIFGNSCRKHCLPGHEKQTKSNTLLLLSVDRLFTTLCNKLLYVPKQ